MQDPTTQVKRTLLLGTAVCVCLGIPLSAQAGSYDPQNNISRADRNQGTWWSDSRYERERYGNADLRDTYYDDNVYPDSVYPDNYHNSYRNERNDREYTDQYGDLDNTQDTTTMNDYRDRNRYRSASTREDRNYRNNFRGGDSNLQRAIRDELESSPYVDADKIDVRVRNGVATLSGTVEDRDAMMAAEENAYEAGAKKVDNNIRVSRRDARPWHDMSNQELAQEVRDEFWWSPFVDGEKIRVSAREGVVTLKGTVEDQSEMSAAVENAYEAGARRVENQLRTRK